MHRSLGLKVAQKCGLIPNLLTRGSFSDLFWSLSRSFVWERTYPKVMHSRPSALSPDSPSFVAPSLWLVGRRGDDTFYGPLLQPSVECQHILVLHLMPTENSKYNKLPAKRIQKSGGTFATHD